MQQTMSIVGAERILEGSFDEIVAKTESALVAEGFGVLTRIDVQATLDEKIGARIAPYVILGACMPRVAHHALEQAPEVGLMMPCNVVVREIAPGRAMVQAIDATSMAQAFPRAALEEVASEVNDALHRAIDGV